MSKLKIPFGWHMEEKIYKDARLESVMNGDQCGCICDGCGKQLQAVQGEKRGDYFRHKSLSECKGGLESLMHKMAKQIIKENQSIYIDHATQFDYDQCEIEVPRYSKQPDIYVSNSSTTKSMIVEIFYSHRIEDSTLKCYWSNNERVLEVDISCTGKRIYQYEELTELILKKAPREILDAPAVLGNQDISMPGWLKMLLGAVAAGIIYTLFFKKKKRRR